MIQGWNDEQIKVILSFDNGRTYESKTHAGDSNSIVSFIKNEVEQVNYSNMFGSVNSNEITLTLFDISDRLNCENKQSPYYNYMRYGVKIEAFISYDDGVK